jgi:tetratricopeptide (TPR) repeat protein
VLRPATASILAAAVALTLGAATAASQQTAPTTPTAPATPTTPAGPPVLDSLRLPKVVSAQQGHARFLVGVRLSAAAKLTVQLLEGDSRKVVQTVTDASERPAGRAYLRVEAVDSSGFQLLQGSYRLRLQATDGEGRVSSPVEQAFRLRLTAPRGQFDAYTVPLWRAFQREAGTTATGQLVAVVGPKGTAATAGIRRGDVVTAIDGRSVATAGAMAAALRALPADKAVTVELLRDGQAVSASLTPKPDWEKAPDYAAALAVAVRREPRTLAYAYAQARQLIDSAKLEEARDLMAGWPRSWRTSAPGQLAQAELLAKQTKWKQALGAYSRARARDKANSAAELGRGIALSERGQTAPSIAAFAAASRLDPGDPAAAGFRAYALLRADRVPEAVAVAQTAVGLDPRYADAFLPLGIALLAAGDKANGVKALRRGLVLLEDAERADRMIRAHLVRADP